MAEVPNQHKHVLITVVYLLAIVLFVENLSIFYSFK